jgi:2-methylcitrate dehydratase PrpD
VQDVEVAELRGKLTLEPDSALSVSSARLVIKMRDGAILRANVDNCLGSQAKPMTDEDISTKFRGLALNVIGEQAAEILQQYCWQLRELDDAGVVAKKASRM